MSICALWTPPAEVGTTSEVVIRVSSRCPVNRPGHRQVGTTRRHGPHRGHRVGIPRRRSKPGWSP
jgi:hypothetical protein